MKVHINPLIGLLALLASDGRAEPLPPRQIDFNRTSPTTWRGSWDSVEGRAYFIQVSEDLVTWSYVPQLFFGAGAELALTLDYTTPKRFMRLRFDPLKLSTAPELDDVDGDGIGSLAELLAGLDPLAVNAAVSSDGDSIPDVLELALAGNLTTFGDISNQGGSGVRDAFEVEAGVDPLGDETTMGGKRTNYLYDAMGRLTHAGSDPETHDFTFDTEGNLESSSVAHP